MRVVAGYFRSRHKQNRATPLTADEIKSSHKLIQLIQNTHFSSEIRTLQKDRIKEIGGKLQSLNPFIDKQGILRVGGRLSNTPIPFQQKYPIILPKDSVTELIIQHEYLNNHHSGTRTTLYAVRQHYWLVDGRSQVSYTYVYDIAEPIHPPVEYLMGDFPEARITESHPFVDYCDRRLYSISKREGTATVERSRFTSPYSYVWQPKLYISNW
jgi:hypothetical protein